MLVLIIKAGYMKSTYIKPSMEIIEGVTESLICATGEINGKYVITNGGESGNGSVTEGEAKGQIWDDE